MKKLTLLFLFAFGTLAQAQQLPLFSQYYFNSFIYNPSHTGLKTGTAATLVARKQFTGLDNSIGTYAATLQTRGANKRSGFGFYVYNDNVNLFRTNAINGSYAYHVPLGKERTMSLGLSLSALDHRFNNTNFITPDEGDPIIALLGNEGGFTLDGSAGINFDLGKFSLGLSNLQMFQNQEAFKDNANNKALYTLANHWMFNMGYEYSINDRFMLEPYLLYRKTKAAPGQVDLNLFLNWIDKGYAGIAYRDGMSVSTMLGVNLNQNITAGYSFDITTSELRNVLGNTHEVVLRFDLGRNKTPKTTDNTEILASKDKTKYENQISDLEAKVNELETKRNEPTKRDTVVIEKIVEKVVVKEVPVIKEVIKEIPVRDEKIIETNTKPQVVIETPTKNTPVVRDLVVSDPIVTDPIINKPTPVSGASFYVIAGSFANSSSANVYINTLAQKGHSGFQWYDNTNGRYYVHLGEFANKSDAVNLIQAKKSSGLPLWVKAKR